MQLRCVLAKCDQGLGSCAVGAARELDGPCPPRPARTVTPMEARVADHGSKLRHGMRLRAVRQFPQ